MPSQIVKVTVAAACLSATSNLLSQILDAYRHDRPFVFDALHFLRFIGLAVITTPPNYKWQQFLEKTFPAYAEKSALHDVEAARPEKEKDKEEKPKAGSGAQHKVGKGGRKLNWTNTFAKWFIDCITIGALVNTALFFIVMGLLKGQSSGQIVTNVKNETMPLIFAGYKVWPLVSIISFSFVPMELRIIFINIVGLFWGIYLSLVANSV